MHRRQIEFKSIQWDPANYSICSFPIKGPAAGATLWSGPLFFTVFTYRTEWQSRIINAPYGISTNVLRDSEHVNKAWAAIHTWPIFQETYRTDCNIANDKQIKESPFYRRVKMCLWMMDYFSQPEGILTTLFSFIGQQCGFTKFWTFTDQTQG